MAKKTIREEIRTPDLETGEIVVTPAITIEQPDPLPLRAGPVWKTNYNHDTDHEAARTGTENTEPTKTQQSQFEDTEINTILKRFNIGGNVPLARIPPSFMDVPELDMPTALNMIHEAGEAFMQLPAHIRSQFNNSLGLYSNAIDAAIARGDVGYLRGLGIDVPETAEEARKAQEAATAAAAAAAKTAS